MSSKSTTAQAVSASIITGKGVINKLIINTHSSGVIRLVDSPNSSAGRVILSDYTLPAGAQVLDLNLEYYEGVYVLLVSGSATYQVAYTLN